MENVTLRDVSQENWLATLKLEVHPDQQRFVAEYAPIAAIGLAKAYIHPGGMEWKPYAIYAGATVIGFVALAYAPDSVDECWIFHFFIDQRLQGQGYGRAALAALIALVEARRPDCQTLRLVVHPENHRARRLYTSAGFRATGETRWEEPVYRLALRDPR